MQKESEKAQQRANQAERESAESRAANVPTGGLHVKTKCSF